MPCSRCASCLANRQRVWAHRIMLEAHQHDDNAFVTLTYDDDHLPMMDSRPYGGLGELPTLRPVDLQLWLKRLRKMYAPARFRFFAAGEYGPQSWRPHYHLALFAFPTCRRGRTRRRPGSERAVWLGCCDVCELVGGTWSKGDVDLGVLEPDSARYVAGYVNKKLTHRTDRRLLGRDPEFARQSRRPGIGHGALHEVASQLMRFNLDSTQSDVPVTLRHGRQEWPLGRYMRRKLRTLIGKEENAPQETLEAIKEEMRPLRESAFNASRPLKAVYQEVNKGRVASFHARQRIRKQKRDL